MIERYEDKPISNIWSDSNKYRVYYEIEKSIAQSNADCMNGYIHEWKEIDFRDPAVLDEITRIEEDTKHDVVAFIQYICEENPKNARFIHSGLTSSDLVDSFNSFALQSSVIRVLNLVDVLWCRLSDIEIQNTGVNMLGRTHGQHATVLSLSHKLEVYRNQLKFIKDCLQYRMSCLFIKAFGPVGNSEYMNEYNKCLLSARLDINFATNNMCTQVLPRTYYMPVMANMLSLSMMLSSMATDLRLLNQNEIQEFAISKSEKQVGSSSMPHKTNPILLERVCGMSRLVKGYFMAFVDNIVLWNERDISNSSVEREVFPNIFHAVCKQLRDVIKTLDVGRFDKERIKQNLDNASIDILDNLFVRLHLIKNDVSYFEACEAVKKKMERYKGMKIKDLLHDNVYDKQEIEVLKRLGVI